MQNGHLREQLQTLPLQPGVYMMKDGEGKIIYVGKAAVLRDRVRSYFGSPASQPTKVQNLMAKVADFEFIVTDTEQGALILECNLIKRYRPHYNVRFKDDKGYPYIKIDVSSDFPRVFITRRVDNDGARYFGPYADAGSVRMTRDLLKKLFPFCSCTRPIPSPDTRPCLDYYMHRCLGPCIGACTREEYAEVIRQIVLFLEGKQEDIVKQLRHKMEEAAENWAFERAASLRDQLQAVEKVIERQKSFLQGDQDVVAFAQDKDQTCVQVFLVRSGRLIGREHFVLEGTLDEEPMAVMAGFIEQFYASAPYLPPCILLQHPVEDSKVIERWLSERAGRRVRLHVPRRGEKKKLVDLVAVNAERRLEQLKVKWMADVGKTTAAMEELQEGLNLPNLPNRVECYDISNIQGTSAVGSMVVFEKGKPKSTDYRRFRIKTVEGANDYAMVQEVLQRRFKRAGSLKENQASGNGWAQAPDLIIIDGGRGQLNAALEVMREMEVDFIPVAGLAKENEELFVPEVPEPVVLPRNSQGLYLLQRIRDEAHRFALAYHQKVRKRSTLQSAMDAVPGIGPKRKKALLKHFGTVKAIREASIDELAAVVGMTRSLAEKVKQHL